MSGVGCWSAVDFRSMISRSLLDTKVSPRRRSIWTSLRQNSVSVFAPRPLHLTLTCSASLRRVSAMNSTIVLQTVPKRIWQMPIVPESYDRHPLLSDEEREALTRYVQDHAAVYARTRLARLEQPLMDVMHLRSQDKGRTCAVRKVMFEEMFRRGTTFWAWSYEDWCAVLQPSSKLFLQRHERHEESPLTIMDAAYLLGGFSDLQAVR